MRSAERKRSIRKRFIPGTDRCMHLRDVPPDLVRGWETFWRSERWRRRWQRYLATVLETFPDMSWARTVVRFDHERGLFVSGKPGQPGVHLAYVGTYNDPSFARRVKRDHPDLFAVASAGMKRAAFAKIAPNPIPGLREHELPPGVKIGELSATLGAEPEPMLVLRGPPGNRQRRRKRKRRQSARETGVSGK